MARLQLRTVNKEIKKLGHDIELVKGDGYFYFVGDSLSLDYSTSVMVYSLNQLDLEDWIEELNRVIGETQ